MTWMGAVDQIHFCAQCICRSTIQGLMKLEINAKCISTTQGKKIEIVTIQQFYLGAVVKQEMSSVVYNKNYLAKLYHYKK